MAVHIFYSEHTVYFPDPLCCARNMAELFSIQKALHKGELFGVAYFLVIHLGFICFAACFCELIAAGCILKSTFNSTDFFLYLGNCESFNELWDGLKISLQPPVNFTLCTTSPSRSSSCVLNRFLLFCKYMTYFILLCFQFFCVYMIITYIFTSLLCFFTFSNSVFQFRSYCSHITV